MPIGIAIVLIKTYFWKFIKNAKEKYEIKGENCERI